MARFVGWLGGVAGAALLWPWVGSSGWSQAPAPIPTLVQVETIPQLYERGNRARSQGNYRESERIFREVLRRSPNDASAHYNLGLALRHQGNLNGAIDSYRRAVSINPNHASAHYNLGNALRDHGSPQSAITSYRRAIAVEPSHVSAHTNLGVVLRAQGDLEGAIASYRRALAIAPNHASARINLGNALAARGDLEGAIATYRQILAAPDTTHAPPTAHAQAHNGLAHVLMRRDRPGDLEAALTHLDRALALAPNYADAQNRRQTARERLSRRSR